jgi:hypothetical protein
VTEPEPGAPASPGWLFWCLVPVGVAISAVGVLTFVDRYAAFDERRSFLAWTVGLNLLHDVALVPATLVVGAAVHRFAPRAARGALQFGLIGTAVVLFLAWRPLTDSGAHVHNPTVQPLDYPRATATALLVVWFLAGVGSLVVTRIDRRRATKHGVHRREAPSNDAASVSRFWDLRCLDRSALRTSWPGLSQARVVRVRFGEAPEHE